MKMPLRIAQLRQFAPLYMAASLALAGGAGICLSATALLASSTQPIQTGYHPSPEVAIHTDVSDITRLNLFGAVAQEQHIDLATLPLTNLNLKLAGIIANAHPENSRCMISENGKPAQTFFIGDPIAGDAKLQSIASDFVILQRGERLEKILLHPENPIAVPVHNRQMPMVAESPPPPMPAPTAAQGPSTENVYKGLEDRLAAIRKDKSQ